VDHRLSLAGGRDGGDELVPGRQDEAGLAQGELQHQRAERLRDVAHLRGRRQPRRVGGVDGAQAGDGRERLPLVQLRMSKRMQRDQPVSRAARPAPQRHLLGHRPGREEHRGGEPEQRRDPPLELSDDAVAVRVDRSGQVDAGRTQHGDRVGGQRGQPSGERRIRR
jgi:hypothetical protein